MAEDKKKSEIPDITSLLFPAVEEARRRERAILKGEEDQHIIKSHHDDGFIGRLASHINNPDVNFSARLYQSHYEDDVWDKERKGITELPLYTHLPGRIGVRTLSRGLLGAAAMAAGSTFIRTYDWHAMEEAAKVASKFGKKHFAHRLIYNISKGIDATLGQGIYQAGKTFYRMRGITSEAEIATKANKWVTFRSKENYSDKALETYVGASDEAINQGMPLTRLFGRREGFRGINSRTLGEEMTCVTGDFWLGTGGDALGMEISSYLDPNVKKDWLDEDGFHPDKLAVDIGQSLFTIVSYRQMEDVAAALPYVYQMKLLNRNLIPKMFPGSKIILDANNGGSAVKIASKTIDRIGINDAKMAKVEVVGDYALPAAIDLQARFMFYNTYTLMFRDFYHQLAEWASGDKNQTKDDTPEESGNIIEQVGHGASETAKYFMKSLIKSSIYMFPAVIPFWTMRVPLDQNRGSFLDADGGLLVNVEGNLAEEYFKRRVAQDPESGRSLYSRGLHFSKDIKYAPTRFKEQYLESIEKMANPLFVENNQIAPNAGDIQGLINGEFATNKRDSKRSTLSKFLSPISKLGERYEKIFKDNIFDPIYGNSEGKFAENIKSLYNDGEAFTPEKLKSVKNMIAQDFVRSSMAYTPYMMLKRETANLYDTPEMDASIMRFLDGVGSLDMKEAKAGLDDIGRTITLNPVSEVTNQRKYDGRGLIHSKQHDDDKRAKKQGKISITHHDASKIVSDVKREHEKRIRLTSEAISEETPDNSQNRIGDPVNGYIATNVESKEDDNPATTVASRNLQYDQSHAAWKAQGNISGAPDGATIH